LPEETFGEKTEEPTPRRREEARERGHVAKSVELNAAIVLLIGMLGLYLFGSNIFRAVLAISRYLVAGVCSSDPSVSDVQQLTHGVIVRMAWVMAPFMLLVAVAALASNMLQVGFVLSSTPIIPDFKRLSPISGLKKVFSMRGLVRLLVSLGKVAVIGTIAYATIRSEAVRFTTLVDMEFGDIFGYAASVVLKLGFRVGLALLVLAILDYGYQRWQYEKDLRMSRQEVREELKRMEGDPHVRERRRRLQRQLALSRMMAEVPKAQVVITNPTELALAIRYDNKTMKAPKLVAKGRALMARRIVQKAVASDVPIVENKPLARSLFRIMDVGEEIPVKYYEPVAEVLAYVYRLNNRLAAAAAG